MKILKAIKSVAINNEFNGGSIGYVEITDRNMESILLRLYGVSPDKIVARGGYLHIISPSSALDSLEANENLYTRTDKEVEAYNATLALLNEAESKGYGAIIARMSQ